MVVCLNMEESEKSKEKIELKELEALEKSIKFQDKQKIIELLIAIGSSKIFMKKYLAVINSQVSFKLTIENNSEEE